MSTLSVPSMAFAWYAVSVKPKHERTTAAILTNKGLEAFNPMCRTARRWSDRIKEIEMPLFPGYLFCRLGYDRRLAVLSTPGVTSIISAGKQPVPVSDEEIGAVQSIVTSGYHAVPWPYLPIGRKVQVINGCLEGLVGTVVRDKGIYRVVVNVELLQRSVAVEIARGDLVPVRLPAQSASHPQFPTGPAGPLWL